MFRMSLCYLVISIFIISLSKKCVLVAGTVNEVSCQNPNFLVISTIDGNITAVDASNGNICWSVELNKESFLSSSLSRVKIYDNGRRVSLVPSLDGGLYKYDDSSKVIVPLPFNVDYLINQPYFFDRSTSIIGAKIKRLYGINSLTGEIIYVCQKNSCDSFISSFPENILVIEEISQFANAVDLSKAEQKWYFRVSDLTLKLASQSSSINPFKDSNEKNALIPRMYQDFVNLDISMYKISLQKGFAGMLNKTTQDFSWSFKSSSPITDVWYVKDNQVKYLDPFDSESGFFSVDEDDGQHFALLFLGSFQNQLFIKKSKNFSMKETSLAENALSGIIFHESYVVPVCSKSENSVVLGSSSFRREDLNPTLRFNVTDYGTYFYINYTVFENKTHCVINATYTVTHGSTSQPNYQLLVIYISTCVATCLFFLVIYPKVIVSTLRKEYKKLKLSLDSELLPSDKDKEFHSRFDQDFEYLSTLGRGGFGIVMDVKNKIDDCRYAVKRICLHERLNKTQYERVLREVKALAKLDHHGIVRYFNAWTEYPPMGWQEEKDKEYNIGCFRSWDSDSALECSIMKSSTTQKSVSNSKKTHPKHLSKFNKHEVSKTDLKYKLIQNPLAVAEDDLLNIDSELNSNILSENQEGNRDSSFITYTKISKSDESSDEIMSHEDSAEETSHDSQGYHNMDENNDSFSVVFEDSNKSPRHEDNVLAEYEDSKSSHESSDIIDETLNIKCLHNNCLSLLNSLNGKMIYKLNSNNFDLLCIYFFHDENNSCMSVTENSWWKNILKENAFMNKPSFVKWLICILCFIRSSEDIVCPLLVVNLCCILSEVNKNLSSMKNEHKLPKKDLHKRTFVLGSAKEPMVPFPRGYLYIQMQLCQRDSLRDWIDLNNTERDYEKVMHIFTEIVEAVHYVHSCGLMHRDLKPSNIYFSLEGAIKIGDFGLATSSEIDADNINNSIQSYTHTSDIGTELYMSPEQKMDEDYDSKTDIYSLGLILFELLVPFKTATERIKVLLQVRELIFPENFTAQFVKESELLSNLLDKDPENRPTTEEIRRSLMLIKVPAAEAP